MLEQVRIVLVTMIKIKRRVMPEVLHHEAFIIVKIIIVAVILEVIPLDKDRIFQRHVAFSRSKSTWWI